MIDKSLRKPGAFVISLDFELFWGLRLSKTVGQYGFVAEGARTAIPLMLNIFRENDVRVTFATVGALFFRTKADLVENLPQRPVSYLIERYNWYPDYLEKAIGISETEDPYHFGASLVELIRREGCHELATHTLTHCYALESKRQPDAFHNDLERAIASAKSIGIHFESIVFPGNQYDSHHLQVCKALGLRGYRANERGWMYEPRKREQNGRVRRLARLMDSYVNLTGHQTCGWNQIKDPSGLFTVPASRFLRPYNPKLKLLDGLRLRRITKAMTAAARQGQIYHLWWHPHNFGMHTEQNLTFLGLVLEHYQTLRKKYDFQSLTMSDCYP